MAFLIPFTVGLLILVSLEFGRTHSCPLVLRLKYVVFVAIFGLVDVQELSEMVYLVTKDPY